MYADKFHSKTTPPKFNTFESYRAHIQQFGQQNVDGFMALEQIFGRPDLSLLSHKYGDKVI